MKMLCTQKIFFLELGWEGLRTSPTHSPEVPPNWYYLSLPQTGNLTEDDYINAVKYVLSQLGNDCGLLLYKSIDGDKQTFQKA